MEITERGDWGTGKHTRGKDVHSIMMDPKWAEGSRVPESDLTGPYHPLFCFAFDCGIDLVIHKVHDCVCKAVIILGIPFPDLKICMNRLIVIKEKQTNKKEMLLGMTANE